MRRFLWLGMVTACLVMPPTAQAADQRPNHLPKKDLLAKADQIEIYSLDPGPRATRKNDPKAKQLFHGWPVLGTTTVKDAAVRKKLVASLEKAVADSNELERAFCFEPRHAIRVNVGKKKVDWVICFHCNTIRCYVNDKGINTVATRGAPEGVLDKLLKAAGVALAPKANKKE